MNTPLPRCPVEVTLSLIGDRWKVLILRELLYGTRRFGQLRKSIGKISTKVLTANLRSMEDSGLLTRKTYPEVPPKVEYTLTETGYSLKPLLASMVEWGSQYKNKMEGQIPMRLRDGRILLIQLACRQDLPELLELQDLAYQSEAEQFSPPNIPPLTQTLRDVEQDYEKGVILKAVDDNETIIGSVRGYEDEGTLFVGKLIVHPDFQGQGIGVRLLSEIENHCPLPRYELFTNNKSKKNLQLYERLGYKPFKEQHISDGLSFIYLEKEKS